MSKSKRILMLEDDKHDADQLRRTLEPYYEVIVTDATDGVRRKLPGNYDCLIFDYDIKGERKGIELLLELREAGVINAPCILMSLYNPPTDVKGFGFTGFIDKTAVGWPDRLLTAVQEALEKKDDGTLRRMLESVGCLKDPLDSYKLQDALQVAGKRVNALILGAQTVSDLLDICDDSEVSESPKATVRELLRRIYIQKQSQRFGRVS